MGKIPKVVILGQSTVLRNLNKAVNKYKERSEAAMWRALFIIERKAIPLTPVDTGNLRRSIYRNAWKTQDGVVGEIGYTATYAPYVHEIPPERAKHKPPTQWKFLEKGIVDSKDDIIDVFEKDLKGWYK